MRAYITRLYRRLCHVLWWLGRCVAYAGRGIVSRTQNWALAGGGVVGLATEVAGVNLTTLSGWQGALVSGAAGIGAAWLILFAGRLLIAPFRMWKGGRWYGREYIYDEPKLAFSVYVSPKDNNFVHRFTVPEAPPFSFIKYIIETSQPKIRQTVLVAPHQNGIPQFTRHDEFIYGGGGFVVGKYREMCMTTFLHPDHDAISVRIKITGWEKR